MGADRSGAESSTSPRADSLQAIVAADVEYVAVDGPPALSDAGSGGEITSGEQLATAGAAVVKTSATIGAVLSGGQQRPVLRGVGGVAGCQSHVVAARWACSEAAAANAATWATVRQPR